MPAPTDDLESCLNALIKGAVDRSVAEKVSEEALRYYDAFLPEIFADSAIKDSVAKTAEKLRQSHYPVIVCGTSIVKKTTPDLAADSGLLLHAAKARAGDSSI